MFFEVGIVLERSEFMTQDEKLIREQICDVCHKMWQLGGVAANDGNVSVRLDADTIIATPTGISKSFITPEKLVKLNLKGEIVEAEGDYRPSSEIKMHIRCYEEREDVRAVVHAHPPIATGFALAHIPLDTYSVIESAIVVGAITPYLPDHDVMLLENHGALTVGSDVITAYYRMETLELVAKTTFHGRMLLSTKGIEEQEIARPTLERLFSMRENYKVTGRHPGYRKYNGDGSIKEIEK